MKIEEKGMMTDQRRRKLNETPDGNSGLVSELVTAGLFLPGSTRSVKCCSLGSVPLPTAKEYYNLGIVMLRRWRGRLQQQFALILAHAWTREALLFAFIRSHALGKVLPDYHQGVIVTHRI